MDNQEPVSTSSTPSVNMDIETTESKAVDILPRVTIEQLLLAGAHFGHLTQRWNPKMKRFIFSARNGIYLIDLNKTKELIETACKKAAEISAKGDDILFVGTKKQARDIVESEAKRSGCPYVTYRWLGGMLTNYSTIRRSLKTLESHERMSTDGTYEKLTKKEQLSIEKSKQKLLRVLGGIRDMRRLPGAVFIVDTNHEAIAVAEARKLDIPIFAIVDTNVDPDLVDYPIPANDDAFKSIGLIARTFSEAVIEGMVNFKETHATEEPAKPERLKARSRRSRRRRSRKRQPASETLETQGSAADSGASTETEEPKTKASKAEAPKAKAEKKKEVKKAVKAAPKVKPESDAPKPEAKKQADEKDLKKASKSETKTKEAKLKEKKTAAKSVKKTTTKKAKAVKKDVKDEAPEE